MNSPSIAFFVATGHKIPHKDVFPHKKTQRRCHKCHHPTLCLNVHILHIPAHCPLIRVENAKLIMIIRNENGSFCQLQERLTSFWKILLKFCTISCVIYLITQYNKVITCHNDVIMCISSKCTIRCNYTLRKWKKN